MLKQTIQAVCTTVLAVASVGVLAETSSLTLTVKNIQSTTGNLFINVFDSKETFLGDTKVLSKEVVLEGLLKDGAAVVELELPYGTYAIAVYHDDNANGKLDHGFFGIPSEPMGLSNNHVPKFGPPKFAKAAMEVAEPQQVTTIELID
ncbi:DUF2141 domain-containing protein [Microbulbifer bruguierae]|uniref:DUF2141 domain-containing protein n=1 Tax=Microbulbifer bruguierae TaxID=3029061 RepID=A0ABY8ND41_9GAMM|nr:DUF2141 domain-containing protein [Microbulbifer bruguierae]WGL16836.1 DUF2141 domain-containing protein [Microbulbifer bruguierae]